MTEALLIVICAWILDAILGDPESMPHPVRLIGRLIQTLESVLRTYVPNLKFAGVVLGITVPASVFLLTLGVTLLAFCIGPACGFVVSTILVYTCLSTKSLSREALRVLRFLREDDIKGARKQLARIVGRDTQHLDRQDVIRATVETVGENTVDGIIAPLFYACIGGAPLAMAYKAVNTLDSMVGYKNERYRDFGCFSARLDDCANYIPARLSPVLIALAVLVLMPGRLTAALRIGMRDCRNTPSPNAGFPEACFAGALGIQLGGPAVYGGVQTTKPHIGDAQRPSDNGAVKEAVVLMWGTSFFSLAVFGGCSMMIGSLIR